MIGEVLTFLVLAGFLGWLKDRFGKPDCMKPQHRSFRLTRKPNYKKIEKLKRELEEKEKRATERFFRIMSKRAVENLEKEFYRQKHGIIWHTDFTTGEVTWERDPRFYPEDCEK